MYIGIDGNEANVENRVGSNTYAFEILKHLHLLDTKTEYRVYLKSSPLEDLPKVRESWEYHVFGPSKLWTQWRLPLELFRRRPRPAVFFTPGHYAPRVSPVPSIISIMDLAFLRFPDSFQPSVLKQLKSWTEYSVKQAAHIFAISEQTKSDIVTYYNIPSEKITVTHLGTKPIAIVKKPQQIEELRQKFKFNQDYFVFIGTRQPRKNLERLEKAFIEFSTEYKQVSLVIVGKVWHQFTETKPVDHPNIVYTDYLPEEDLQVVLNNAKALVFPSLYEGFGLPVLEAMSAGVLVTASNVSSIPEITGTDWPLLFNPTKPNEITKSLKTIMHMSREKQQSLRKSGKIRARQFTWENCAKKTMEVLHEFAVS